MTLYRVGAEGATVFDADGNAITRLRPGMVVVAGTTETASTAAEQDRKAKRQRGYADKVIHPSEDKAP
jgi:hypothetical protein